MRVFLAVHLHRLELEVFRPTWSPEPPAGAAVLERGAVLRMDRTARAAGVRPGMKRGGVLTLAPGTLLYDRDPAKEADAQREVAFALMRFSPETACVGEATVLVDVSASLRLFGGVQRLTRAARQCVETLGLSARVSAAPTGEGAWLLARQGRRRLVKMPSLARALGRLPLAMLRETRPFADWFDGLGCTTLGDLRRLPRAGLLRRCNAPLIEALDRAFGLAPELFDWLVPPPTFTARLELPDRIEHAEAAQHAGERLIAQLCGWLCAQQLALTHARVSLEHERGREAIDPSIIEIALGEPTWRDEHLNRLLKERLGRIELAAPVIALKLEAVTVAPAAPVCEQLFPEPGGSPQDHARLLELLVARLGAERVLKAVPGADHRPEIANRWLPVHDTTKAAPLPATLPRPAWLLDTPTRLLTRKDRPFYGSQLRMVSPPERIEAGWFDGRIVLRDYFVAQGDDQSCYWIYRERVVSQIRQTDRTPQTEPQDQATPAHLETGEEGEARWFLHGLFG